MKFNLWIPALAGLMLVAGVRTLEASPPSESVGESVDDIRASFKAAKRDKSLTVDQTLAWVDQLFVLAEEGAGTDPGFKALGAIMELTRGTRSQELKDAAEFVPGMLIEGYSDDFEKMDGLLRKGALEEQLVADLFVRTTNDRVKGACLVAEIDWALEHASYGPISEQRLARGLRAIERLAGPYGDLENGAGITFREATEAPAFQLQNLRIGMVAPEIVGNDFDGVEFKLSDYRGKVVVLDFWGNW